MVGRRKSNLEIGMSRLYVYHGKRHDTYYTVDRHNKYINLGHDLIEDKCKYQGELITFQMLRDLGFSERVVEGIRCLTKLPGETLREYIEKVKSNIDAVLVSCVTCATTATSAA